MSQDISVLFLGSLEEFIADIVCPTLFCTHGLGSDFSVTCCIIQTLYWNLIFCTKKLQAFIYLSIHIALQFNTSSKSYNISKLGHFITHGLGSDLKEFLPNVSKFSVISLKDQPQSHRCIPYRHADMIEFCKLTFSDKKKLLQYY
jgi:hypothetical protein